MEKGLRALAAELGGPPPSGLSHLRDEDLLALAGAVRDARRRHAAEVTAAGERALGHVPRLLRGAVRKVAG